MSLFNLNWTVDFYEENTKDCDDLLSSLENFDDIPCINYVPLQNLQDGELVHFRGMVQDMLNPEYYSPSYTVFNTRQNKSYERSGKFRDVPNCKADEEFKENETEVIPKGRQVFFCIPIPGSNDWVETHLKKLVKNTKHTEKTSGSVKRKNFNECLDDGNKMEISIEPASSSEEQRVSPINIKKNKQEELKEIMNDGNIKCEGHQTSEKAQNAMCNLANYFPLQEEKGLPCIIKIYDCDDEKFNLTLNNAIEVVGFLSLNPALEANWEDADLEDKAIHPPPSLVPRIHAVFIRKLTHCNPLISLNPSYDNISQMVEEARSDLRLLFTQLFFEDGVAADFLLCHLLSKVYVRAEGLSIGKFGLNFYNIKQKNFGRYIANIISIIVTNSLYLPLSIDYLNDTTFVPKKDYETNRLWSGLLQLCDDTHLVLDELNMNEGKLNEKGCLNVLALQRLFRDQEIQYDFGYYPVTCNANIPILVLSEGKSMFEADVRVMVRSESATESSLTESYEAVKVYLNNEEVCNKLRIYLTLIRSMEFDLGEDMVKKIGEDYVSMRQADGKVNSSDLHNLLVLSRLLALSHGRKTLTQEDWQRALEMETERKSRLSR